MRSSYPHSPKLSSQLQSSKKSIGKVRQIRYNTNSEVVQEDRQIAIEACVVRIMKSRKKVDHNSLMQEVLQTLLNFKPNP
jgi:hypothetical protein